MLKNSGKTATRNAIGHANSWIGVAAGPLPSNFDYPDYGTAERTLIGPNAEMQSARFDISVDDLQRIRAGTAHAYIWGWCEYDDVFEGTERHRAEFCMELIVTGTRFTKRVASLFACTAHLTEPMANASANQLQERKISAASAASARTGAYSHDSPRYLVVA
ncbi:MAG: hypothetical protein WDM89_12790 [Rhizomicrobium sp.]